MVKDGFEPSHFVVYYPRNAYHPTEMLSPENSIQHCTIKQQVRAINTLFTIVPSILQRTWTW